MLPNRENFCCNDLWKSIIVAPEKPGKLGGFFLLLCGHSLLLAPVYHWYSGCCVNGSVEPAQQQSALSTSLASSSFNAVPPSVSSPLPDQVRVSLLLLLDWLGQFSQLVILISLLAEKFCFMPVELITFRVRCSRGEIYIGHCSVCVCLSLAAFPKCDVKTSMSCGGTTQRCGNKAEREC